MGCLLKLLRKRRFAKIEKLASLGDVTGLLDKYEARFGLFHDVEVSMFIKTQLIKVGTKGIPKLVENLNRRDCYMRSVICDALKEMDWKPSSKWERILWLTNNSSIKVAPTVPLDNEHLEQELAEGQEWLNLRSSELIEKLLQELCDSQEFERTDRILLGLLDMDFIGQLVDSRVKFKSREARERIDEYISMLKSGIFCSRASEATHMANSWWHNQTIWQKVSGHRISSRQKNAMCDKCSELIGRYRGYIVDPGTILSVGTQPVMSGPDLLCDRCYKRYQGIKALCFDLGHHAYEYGGLAHFVQQRAAKQLARIDLHDVADPGLNMYELDRHGFDPKTGERLKQKL